MSPAPSLRALWEALRLAHRGKRHRPDVAGFELDLEARLYALHMQLRLATYAPAPYQVFTVLEPAVRTIAALSFRDRVVQHVLMARVAPRIERSVVPQTWACLPRRGSHGALGWAANLTRSRSWCLRLDIRKFFPSVDHQTLRHMLSRLLRGEEPWVHTLSEMFLTHPGSYERAPMYVPGDDLFAALQPVGLPIGNLTSQWWANLYLSPIDHMLANHLAVREFARYMDDFVVFDDNRERLIEIWRACEEAAFRLRLRLHPRKCRLYSTREGFKFLGFRFKRVGDAVQVRIARESTDRFRTRMAKLVALYEVGAIDPAEVRGRVASWVSHAHHGHTRALCHDLLQRYVFVRKR